MDLHHTLNCRGRLLDLSTPQVMGILNVTPDSFYAASRVQEEEPFLERAAQMLVEGATLLDVGGVSTRPGAVEVSVDEEIDRVIPKIGLLAQNFPEAIISVDTFRAEVARKAVEAGASIINDISAGAFDDCLFDAVAQLNVPYILMHMQGTPQTMQSAPHYENVTLEVLDFFIEKLGRLRAAGVQDVILDPGFGFGKTIEHNYALLRDLAQFSTVTGLPVLAGISRKSMIYKLLNIEPEDTLPANSALHLAALERGARILRAHDVREAVQTIRIWEMLA